MLGRSVGAIAACALPAAAFLLPPGLAPVTNKAPAIADAVQSIFTKSVALTLPCSECVFSSLKKEEKVEDVEDDDAMFWIQGGANNVFLNFSISDDGHRLEVNGETIYPLSYQIENMMTQRVYVDEVPASASVEDIQDGKVKATHVEVTGSGVAALTEEAMYEHGDMLIPIKHSIYEIEKQPVSLDPVIVLLVKDDAGKLSIMGVEVEVSQRHRLADFEDADDEEPFRRPHHGGRPGMGGVFAPPPHHGEHGPGHKGPQRHPGPHRGPHRECKMLPASLCRLKNMIEDKTMGMRKGGCDGGMRHGGPGPRPHLPNRPHFLRPDREGMRPHSPPHHGRPHHMRPHGEHHGHRGHHFRHSFIHSLIAVIIPTMAGVAVGMFVSLVGLLVGRLICFIWITFYRGGRRGSYRRVQLDESSAAEVEDEKILVVEELSESEPLPVYEQAPAYEENETGKETK